ncbi:MAG: hypothetical protein ACPG5P_03955, partial [Saprospiraceae bacterium]
NIFHKSYTPKEKEKEKRFYAPAYLLKKAIRGETDIHNYTYVREFEYNAHEIFYLNLLEKKGINVDVTTKENIKKGSTIFASEIAVNEYITDNYIFELKDSVDYISTYYINGRK